MFGLLQAVLINVNERPLQSLCMVVHLVVGVYDIQAHQNFGHEKEKIILDS